MHDSWTLNWILQGTSQARECQQFPAELLDGPPPEGQWFAAVCRRTQVLCTTAVSCTDSGCWLTTPLVLDEPAELLITFLLQGLKAVRSQFHIGRLLLLTNAENSDQQLQNCLNSVGFQRLATIAEFQRTVDAARGSLRQLHPATPVDVFQLQAEAPVIPLDRLMALQSVTTAATADSQDLTGLPQPAFQQQWREWQQASATVLAATVAGGQYAGLCVLASADNETHTATDAGQKILWLAVRPEFRRMGMATGLVHAAEQFAAKLTPHHETTRLTVDVDLQNTPALRLYSSCGFHRSDRLLELWGD